MRIGFLLLVLASLALAIPLGETHLGRTIPVHIPTQTLTVNDTFEVPYWLGAFYATVEVDSTWTLPLTIGNGGQTYPGEFLIIRNYGPADITLLSTSPETIEAGANYSVPAGSVVELISGYPNWMVIMLSSSTQPAQWIYTFDGTDLNDGTPQPVFTMEIGTNTFHAPPKTTCDSGTTGDCANWNTISLGYSAGSQNSGYNTINIGYEAGLYNTGDDVNNFGGVAGANNTGFLVNNLGNSAGLANTGTSVNNFGQSAGAYNSGSNVNNLGNLAGRNNEGSNANNFGTFAGRVNVGEYVNNIGRETGFYNAGSHVNNIGTSAGANNTAMYANNIGYFAGQFNTGIYAINIGNNAGQQNNESYVTNVGFRAGQYNTGNNVNNIGVNAGSSNTGDYVVHLGSGAGMSNTYDYCHTNGRSSACTATNQFVFGASAYPLHLRLPSDTGSYCTGAAYDTCLNRGRAGAFTLGTDQDLYSTGYFCAGAGCTSSAPVAASTGLYDSNTRVVRSCTAGAGITCSVTDGVLTVTATSGLQKNTIRYVPTSSDSPCEVGDTVFSAPYMYACVAANTWHRFEGSRF